MMPINFPEANVHVVKPPTMTDEECADLYAMKWIDDKGFINWLFKVQPNKEDIDAIKEGRPINVHFISDKFPVIGLFTTDKNGDLNE